MSTLNNMAIAIKNILKEAELRDIANKVSTGDIVSVTLANGESHKFQLLSSTGGNFIMKNDDNKYFTFDVDDYKDGQLTVYDYKGGVGGQSGIQPWYR